MQKTKCSGAAVVATFGRMDNVPMKTPPVAMTSTDLITTEIQPVRLPNQMQETQLNVWTRFSGIGTASSVPILSVN
jgi:hypothetical protein